jgi:hypothetical protein
MYIIKFVKLNSNYKIVLQFKLNAPREKDPLQSKRTGEYPVKGSDISTKI